MKKLLMCGVAAIALSIASDAKAFQIDNFDSGFDFVGIPAPLGPSNTASVDAIGGSRTLQMLAGNNGDSLSVFDSGGGNGVLGAGDAPTGTAPDDGSSSTVTWDANGAGLGGADLTDGGLSNGISIDIIAIDVGLATLTFDITDTMGALSTLDITSGVVGTNNFFFADFMGGADFASVASIVLTLALSNNTDVTLDIIETIDVPPPVPAPASLLLLGTGLLGLGAMARRRRS